MAEPKPAETTPPTSTPSGATSVDAPTKLKAVASAPTAKPASGGGQPTVSRRLFTAVVVLLVLAVAGLYAQTRHARAQAQEIVQLEGQVEGLEVQLSAANTKLAGYDMQMTLIHEIALDAYEKLGDVLHLAEVGPLDAGESPEPGAETPAAGVEPAPTP